MHAYWSGALSLGVWCTVWLLYRWLHSPGRFVSWSTLGSIGISLLSGLLLLGLAVWVFHTPSRHEREHEDIYGVHGTREDK